MPERHVIFAVKDDRHSGEAPTWKWECLRCGASEGGFIKQRYAVAEGRVHEDNDR